MDPQDVGPTRPQQRSERDGRARPVLGQARDFSEKRFARNADDQRTIFNLQTREIGEQLEVVRDRFSKPDSGIERDAHGINASDGPVQIAVEKTATSATTSLYVGLSCIVCGVPCMCIAHYGRAGFHGKRNHDWIARGAVTSLMISAPASIAACATPVLDVSIEIWSRDGRRDVSDYREDSFYLFVRRDRPRARAGRFAANINDRGAVAGHFDAVSNRRLGREKFTAIGKGIGRHVENAHEQRAFGQVDDVSIDSPVGCVHHSSDYHSRRFIRPGRVATPLPSRAAAH